MLLFKMQKMWKFKKSRIMIINEEKNSMIFKVQNLKQKIFLLLMYKNHLFEDFDFHYLESSKRAFFIPKKIEHFSSQLLKLIESFITHELEAISE